MNRRRRTHRLEPVTLAETVLESYQLLVPVALEQSLRRRLCLSVPSASSGHQTYPASDSDQAGQGQRDESRVCESARLWVVRQFSRDLPLKGVAIQGLPPLYLPVSGDRFS